MNRASLICFIAFGQMCCAMASERSIEQLSIHAEFPGRSAPPPVGPTYATAGSPATIAPRHPDGGDTALGRVYQKLLTLRRTYANLPKKANPREAKRLLKKIESLERRFRYPVPAPHHSEPIVHAVGVYQQQQDVNLPVCIRLTDTSGPVVLVLTAYDSVRWNVEKAAGVQIDFVICCGYHDQNIAVLDQEIPVFTFSHERGSAAYAYAYGSDRSQWSQLEQFVERQTGGLRIRTVQGSYTAQSGYCIGPENVDWRLQMLDE